MAAESRRRKLEKDNNGGQQEDRLSLLPESILVDILSHLPLKSAISTSVLSTQWRRVWTQITSVSIENIPFPGSSDVYVTIDGLLNELQSPVIHQFRLHFKYLFEFSLHNKVENTFLFTDSWFRFICGRNVQEFQVSSGLSLSAAPPCIFQTQSLVVLELGRGFDYELLDAAGFNLPNLKKLQLQASVCNYEILANLIKSCPILEDLSLLLSFVLESKPIVFNIWGLNLKQLEIKFCQYDDLHEVIINAPNLEHFTVDNVWGGKYCFVEKPFGLLQAHIWGVLTSSLLGTPNHRELFKAISHVRYLDLCHLELRPQTLFPNLTHLVVPLNDSTRCKELIALLRCCPVLEDLMLDHTNGKPMSGTWIAPQSAPPCLSTLFKRIEILRKSGFEKPFLTVMVKYFLNVVPFLEKVTLNVEGRKSGCKELNQRRELRLYQEICEYPRSSLHCQIEFFGLYIKASGNGKEVRGHDGCTLSLE